MDFADFIRQVPIQVLLAPFVLGGCYIGLMVVIFRRARKRRLAKKEAMLREQNGGMPLPEKRVGKSNSVGNFLSGELPDQRNDPAAWTVPSELRDLPEPDIDMLSMPSLDALAPDPNILPPATTPGTNAGSSAVSFEPDWIASLAATPADYTPVESNSGPDSRPTPAAVPVSSANSASASRVQENKTMVPHDPNAPLPADAVEVMRIYRDMNDGRLIVQMGDQRYRSVADIKNPDLVRRFTTIVRDLWAMVSGNGGAQPAAPTGGTYPVANPQPIDPGVGSQGGGMLSRMGLMTAEPEKPKPGMLNQFARAASGQPTKDNTPAPAGIAGAVEEFLQFKLSTTPQFSTRSIHIRPTPDHGIRIDVDGHYYDAIGDIVEADVRDFMINLMREWEARH